MLPNIHVTSKIPSTQLMTKLCHNKKDYVEWSVLQNNKVSLVLDAPLWRNNKQREMEQNSEPKLFLHKEGQGVLLHKYSLAAGLTSESGAPQKGFNIMIS